MLLEAQATVRFEAAARGYSADLDRAAMGFCSCWNAVPGHRAKYHRTFKALFQEINRLSAREAWVRRQLEGLGAASA